MQQPDFWKNENSLVSLLLMPFAFIYRSIGCLRQIFINSYNADVPVICIGNVTVGGAGKTPVALAIGKILQQKGIKFAFLSRGYGGSLTRPTIVDNKKHSAKEVGDEPLLLSRLATTIIAKNRKAGAELAVRNGAEVIIMDDGLQNPSIGKDMALLVIDGNYGIGNGHIMPAGPLREKLSSAIKKTAAVIFIGEDKTGLLTKLGESKIIRAEIDVPANRENKKFLAFAGIANPDKFFSSLAKGGYDIVKKTIFSDHYQYTENDINSLKNRAESLNACLITTEKDFIRLTERQQQDISILPIEIKWEDNNSIDEIISCCLKKSAT